MRWIVADSNVITIADLDGNPETVFRGPGDGAAARALWVYLVENLRSGLLVELDIGTEALQFPSGEKIPTDMYSIFMSRGVTE